MLGAVLFAFLFAALSWWFLRQAAIFFLQLTVRLLGRETDIARRVSQLGHHTVLDPIALIVGLICGIAVFFLPDNMRNTLLGPGLLIIWGVTIVLYLINRYALGIEDAGRRGF